MSYQQTKVADEGEEYDSEAEEEQEEEEQGSTGCVWKLQFAESVYDDSILRIINMPNDRKTSKPLFWCEFWTVVLVILLNFTLQTLIVTRVHMINMVNRDDTNDKIFGPPLGEAGSCYQRDNNMFPDFLKNAGIGGLLSKHSRKIKGGDSFTWDCSPLLPALLSNVSWLDANNDGVWSVADGISATSVHYEQVFAKTGNLTRVFFRFLDEIRENTFDATRNLIDSERQSQTNDFTQIPMTWMKAEQPILHMCLNVDKELCGSLELRGILKLHIKGHGDTPPEREDKCRKLNDRCDNLFGSIYRNYNYVAAQTCGEMESSWDAASRVTTNSYSKATMYKPGDEESVLAQTYQAFLGLMLVIWWLAVLEELRRVATWMAVLFIMPHDGNVVTQEDPDGPAMISNISDATKAVLFVFIMIPRLAVICALSVIGSHFLIGADDYGDLILNGVALAFIVDIDEIMFASLMGQDAKDTVPNTQVELRQEGCMPCFVSLVSLPSPPFGVIFVITIVSYMMHLALWSPNGKYSMGVAYACLCHMAGPDCLGAQLLGGEWHAP